VFRRGRAVVNLTGDSGCLAALRGPVEELIGSLPAGGEVRVPSRPNLPRVNVGVSIPGEVCYVGRVFRAPAHNDPAAPLVHLLSSHLHDGVIYQKVRVEGGAYGGYSLYNPYSGQLAFLSYRDPNLEKTLQVYDSAIDRTLEEGFDAEAVRKMVISTVALLDRPMDPVTRGYVAMERTLSGLSDADRQRYREVLLAADAASIRDALVKVVKPATGAAVQAVYAPRQRIEEVNAGLREPFEISGLE
jgi:presequence protease